MFGAIRRESVEKHGDGVRPRICGAGGFLRLRLAVWVVVGLPVAFWRDKHHEFVQ